MQIFGNFRAQIARPDLWIGWAERAIRVIVILALAWILTHVARRLLSELRVYVIRMMDRRGDGSAIGAENRAATVISALGKVASFCIWVVALVTALGDLGYQLAPVLAGLGVAGLALGLGAQTLIKDWLGGLFLFLEDQARIGDSVTINGISGAVEEMNLRTTLLRGENGAVHVISNGSITTLSNLTRDYAYYVFETVLAHGSDPDRALKIVENCAAELNEEEPYRSMILAPMEVMGVDRLSERGVTIKGRIKTLPGRQATVGRELNRRVKAKFDAAGIAFPAFNVPA
jgi:moderate conductance mechanosensitive channel